MSKLLDVLQQAEAAAKRPLYITDEGFKVYTFEDANILAQQLLIERNSDMPVTDLGVRELQDNGIGYKQSNVPWVAVDPSTMFKNRYKYVATKRGNGTEEEWQIVTDYLAIKSQKSGRLPQTSVTAYVVKRDKETGKPVVKNTIEVMGEEFIKDFHSEMDTSSMINVSAAIKDYEATGIKTESIFG